jgi:hypothetical protein
MTLGLASFISTFIPTIYGVFYFNKTSKTFKYFSLFLFVVCIIECIGNYLFYSHQRNLEVYSFCLLLETLILPLIIGYRINRVSIKIVFLICLVIYFFHFFYLCYKNKAIIQDDTQFRIFTCLILIFTSGITFLQQSKNMEVHILANPMFILSFAILLYYGSTLFVHSALHIILAKSYTLVAKQIWNAHSVINIITNILFAYAIWLSYRLKKLSL